MLKALADFAAMPPPGKTLNSRFEFPPHRPIPLCPHTPTPHCAQHPFATMKVLIAEDDRLSREILVRC
jgi:hypothetical protein